MGQEYLTIFLKFWEFLTGKHVAQECDQKDIVFQRKGSD